MSKPHRQRKKSPIRQFWRGCRNVISALTAGLVRAILRAGFHRSPRAAGFVLPTVVMVSLVVTLLVAAISFNSFQASKRASNTRVNTTTLNAALPALDRARVKLNQLFQSDPSLPGGTPSDTAINNTLTADLRKYTFGDEDPLEIVADFRSQNGTLVPDGIIQAIAKNTRTPAFTSSSTLADDETSRIAWRFPIDTDNNGKFDSYTLYGIFFRSPNTDANGQLQRARSPLDARTPPMEDGNTSPQCSAAGSTSASLVGTSGWYASGVDQLTFKRGIFVYSVNVPITRLTGIDSTIASSFETYRGNKGISALEYQQDQVRLSLGKNAIVYEDDLEINAGGGIRINGRIQANSNVFLARSFDPVEIFQVSSSASCYYQEANSKIVVGGNIINGFANNSNTGTAAPVYLYQSGLAANTANNSLPKDDFVTSHSSTTQTNGSQVAYNSQAYEQRINFLVESQIYPNGRANPASDPLSTTIGDPRSVREETAKLLPTVQTSLEARTLALQTYFRARTRRVPYGEVAYGSSALGSFTAATVLQRDTVGGVVDLDTLRGPDAWIYPTAAVTSPNFTNVNLTGTGFTTLDVRADELQAVDPDIQRTLRAEKYVGDRILVGNNLPALWYDSTTRRFNNNRVRQTTAGTRWVTASGSFIDTKDRYRFTQVQPLVDLGAVGRNGFWEQLTAKLPQSTSDSVGGLRVITGAGIYGHPAADSTITTANADTLNGLNRPSYMGSPTAVEDPTKTCPNRADCGVALSSTGTFDTRLASIPVVPSTKTPIAQTTHPLAGTAFKLVWPDSMPMQGGADQSSTASVNEATAPLDLRMRATAVYHYSANMTAGIGNGELDTAQVPLACVSSYYDPTTRNTARNRSTFAGVNLSNAAFDVSGGFDRPQRTPDGASAINPAAITNGAGPGGDGIMDELFDSVPNAGGYGIGTNKPDRPADSSASAPDGARSNNGIVYPSPYSTAPYTNVPADRLTAVTTYWNELVYQATLMFPNSRVVNQPLLTALNKFNSSTKQLASASEPLTLADNAAIDTAICGIRILTDSTFAPSATAPPIPHGAIQEISFLDPRQLKQNANDPTQPGTLTRLSSSSTSDPSDTPFDLSIEERMPLEIRATMIDLQQLRSVQLPGTNNVSQTEFLLPLSGLVYATRDDALIDQSDALATISPVDYELDPTRRPSSIVLRNGRSVARYNRTTSPNDDTNYYREGEKGLILVTPLPVYVWGTTNVHENNSFTAAEEFVTALDASWSNFNSRGSSGLNTNFACRRLDPKLPNCTAGDRWRPISIQSDAFTILSDTFRPGFRNQGDYDLRNNWGTDLITTDASGTAISKPLNTTTAPSDDAVFNRRYNGFRNNSYVTSYNFLDSAYSATAPSNTTTPGRNFSYGSNYVPGSYFNNFVTPIQRRIAAPEYIMEICRKVPVSLCEPSDWVVGFDSNGDGDLSDTGELDVTASQLGQVYAAAVTSAGANLNISSGQITFAITGGGSNLKPGDTFTNSGGTARSFLQRLGAGTTARPAMLAADQRFPRRVAFARNLYNALVFTSVPDGSVNRPVARPMGVGCPLDSTGSNADNNGCRYPTNNTRTEGVHYGWLSTTSDSSNSNALWFRHTSTTLGRVSDISVDHYGVNYPLFYVDPVISGYKLILPDVPEFGDTATGTPARTIAQLLNEGGANSSQNPTDYTACIGGSGNAADKGFSTDYQVPTGSLPGSNCPSATDDAIQLAEDRLSDLVTSSDPTITGGTQTLTASQRVNRYNLPNAGLDAGATLTLQGNQSSIFIFDGGNALKIGSGFKLVLKGVDPNKVFWVSNGSMTITGGDTASTPTQLAGNFLGKTDMKLDPKVNNGPVHIEILGGRLLGFSNNSSGIQGKLFAATNNGQPLLAPVLQFHVTQAITADPNETNFLNISGLGSSNAFDVGTRLWQQHAERTIANVLLVTGDTPVRPMESTGSVANLVRYVESWKDGSGNTIPISISGMIMQYRRSAYATAPFQLFTAGLNPSSPVYPTLFSYPQGYTVNNAQFSKDNQYGAQPHYIPPERRFGYDVALQTQSPDQFAQRLTIQPTSRPNEFFREIGSNDPWVQALLCAGVGTWTPNVTQPDGSTKDDFVYNATATRRYAADNSTTQDPPGNSPRPRCPIPLSQY